MQNQGYNQRRLLSQRVASMPSQNMDDLTEFGKRLVKLRKDAGYTQTELANELGITQRMISYYEGHAEHPPSALLPKMAELLGVSADELLGIKPVKKGKQPDTRLQRRFQQIQKLPVRDKRQITQIIDTFIKAAQVQETA